MSPRPKSNPGVPDVRPPLFPDAVFVMPSEQEPRGNAFAILGEVQVILTKVGATKAQIDQFCDEATSGDYEHLRATVRKWVSTVRAVTTYHPEEE